jgi:murein DD-endopeptidase MepM/ murein hydrolase activator NlpD
VTRVPFPRTVHAGLRGNDIYVYKRALRRFETKHGIDHTIGWPVRNGIFTTTMVPTVQKFQFRHGLRADGWIGPKTYAALYPLIDDYGLRLLRRYNRHHPDYIRGYPLRVAQRFPVIGCPYVGTHTLGNWESDRAVDIACPSGTPVVAVWDGVIGPQWGPLSTNEPTLLGLRIHLVRSDAEEAYYAHLRKLVPTPGTFVRRGGLLGYSGVANGVEHLHFATRVARPENVIGQPGVC